MKILWVSHGSGAGGGAELCMIEAIKGLLKQEDITVDVIIPTSGELEEVLSGLASSVNIVYLPWWINESKKKITYARRLYGQMKAALRIRKLIKKINPDVIITNTLVIPSAAIAAKICKVPHIWFIHEFLEEDHNFTFEFGRKASMKIVDNFSAQVIVNSQAVYNRFKKEIPESKLNLVYYSVDVPDISQISIQEKKNDTFSLALVGRKTPSKGQEEAIRAIAVLFKQKIDVCLSLIGGGSLEYEIKLKELANELKVENNINFVSFVKDPLPLFLSADVILICSKSEAFGRVIIEAMKLGKPTIASDTGSTPELIRDGWNGLVYEYGNPESLASRVKQLYLNSSLRNEIGANSYKWSHEKFSLNNYSRDILTVIHKVLAE